MNSILKFNILFVGIAMLVSGCSQEDALMDMPSGNGEYIRIMAGQVGYSTKAIDAEPQVDGQCNADKMIIYQYNKTMNGATTPRPSNLDYMTQYVIDVDHYSDPDGRPYFQSDKWARHTVTLGFTTPMRNPYAFPALAFTEADENEFSVNYSGTMDNLSLSLNGTHTPELYFGRLGVKDSNLKLESFSDDDNETDPDRHVTGIYNYYRSTVFDPSSTTTDLYGKLYRIVSQINVNISNVNTDLVARMTMQLSNVPTQIGLYADHRKKVSQSGSDHGFHYPIVAANTAQQTPDSVIVCETSNFRNGEAKLSTFLLPSVSGRNLRITIYFKEDIFAGEDEEGNPITYREKTYDIRPPKSYYIPADIADAYFSSSPLCVYNVTDNEFFSFSNVRVNLNGDFDNFFPDRVEVDMDIEICSRYDNEHNYGEIDYNQ